MEQVGQRMFVVYIGGRHHRTVREPALDAHANVQLHAEVPLLASAGLVHFEVARLVRVLRGTRRGDDRGVHGRARAHLYSLSLCSTWPTLANSA